MHMPATPRQSAILTANLADGELEAQLWERLSPGRWPLPLSAFPTGTALVGGAVRDALLGRLASCPDLDLVVDSNAIGLARRLARQQGGSCVVLDAERDMARVVLGPWTVDLARQEGGDLASDLRRRDYSANALALPLAAGARLQDPTGGLAALVRGQLVAVSEANLLADPLRLLRGVRLAWELGLTLESTSLHWIGRHADTLTLVAGERVLAELHRLAATGHGGRGLAQALSLKLLDGWGGDASSSRTLLDLDRAAASARGLTATETVNALPLARLATLLPATAVRRLHGSRRLQQRCERLRRWWERLANAGAGGLAALDEPTRLQLHRDMEEDLPALVLRQPAGIASAALIRWRDPGDPLFHPRPPLNGDDLRTSLGVSPGPELGDMLEHLTRERAFGRLPASGAHGRGEALESARRWLDGRRG
jgi:tRNA nucleotidyltransferase (CCA-adding enzyme)